MNKAQVLEFKSCIGCGCLDTGCYCFVALLGPTYICEKCVLACVDIIASKANQESRIKFVDSLQESLKEPIEIVAQWKALSESTDGKTS